MKNLKGKISAAAAALVVLAGCTSMFHAKIAPAALEVTPAECSAIWAAASAELESRGFKVAAYDPVAGTLRTETRVMPGTVPCGFVSCAFRDTVHVTVAPRGELNVRIARELASARVVGGPGFVYAGGAWDPPASTQRATVQGVVSDQEALLRAIVARAKGTVPAPAQPAASPGAPAPDSATLGASTGATSVTPSATP